MPDSRFLGLLLILMGIGVVLVGLLIYAGGFGWFGRLPGDLRLERENTRIHVPIVSMLVLSVVFSLLVSFLRRWF